jgi:hypothetical protein
MMVSLYEDMLGTPEEVDILGVQVTLFAAA